MTNEQFKSSDFSLSLQKKVLGKFANKSILKRFIDEHEARVLDNLHKSIKLFTLEAAQNGWQVSDNGDKVVKNLIKISVKISVLYMNGQFTNEEKIAAHKLQRDLHTTMMTVLSFHEVEYSYDRKFLIAAFDKYCVLLKQLVAGHLSDKSAHRIDNIMNLLCNGVYLDFLFGTLKSKRAKSNEEMLELRTSMVNDLRVIIERYSK